jgi:alpha-1,6-mannosyltransferase
VTLRPEHGRGAVLAWIATWLAFDAGALLASRSARPAYDFVASGRISAHVSEPTLLPVALVQNSAAVWPWYALAFVGFAILALASETLARTQRLIDVWRLFAVAAVAAVALPCLPTTDPYAYALNGYVAGPLHADPWTPGPLPASGWGATLAQMFPDADALVRRCNYGPVFVAVYASLALVFHALPLGVFIAIERVFCALCVAGAGLAVMRAAPVGSSGASRVARLLLNPLVVLELVAFAHGEALLLALLGAAFLAWTRRTYEWAAALTVLAAGVRSVAVLAVVALLLAAWRMDARRLPRIVAAVVATCVVMFGFPGIVYHDVSLGGLPLFNPWSAPFIFAAGALHLEDAFAAGVIAALSVASLVAYLAMRSWWKRPGAQLAWLPICGMIASPALYAHYVVWFVSMRAVTDSRRIELVARAATAAAPLLYAVHLNPFPPPGSPPWAYAIVETVVWGTIVVAAVVAARMPEAQSRERLRAGRFAAP